MKVAPYLKQVSNVVEVNWTGSTSAASCRCRCRCSQILACLYDAATVAEIWKTIMERVESVFRDILKTIVAGGHLVMLRICLPERMNQEFEITEASLSFFPWNEIWQWKAVQGTLPSEKANQQTRAEEIEGHVA